MKNTSYITDIKKVKGSGSAKGLYHWKWQRISAIALAMLFTWFIYMIMGFFENPDYTISKLLYSPFSLLFFIILINVSIYHGVLGFREICEDYIHNAFWKNSIIIAVYFISIITMSASTFALFLNFGANI